MQLRSAVDEMFSKTMRLSVAKSAGRSLLFWVSRSHSIGRKNRMRAFNLLATRTATDGPLDTTVPIPEMPGLDIKVRLELSDELSRQWYFFGYDHYEISVRKVLAALVDDLPSDGSSQILDVGGNLGYFTLFLGALAHAKNKGHVHAFEPSPRVFQMLKRNVSLNPAFAITLNEAAVSNTEGRCTLFLAHEDYGHSGASLLAGAVEQVGGVEVVTLTLDGYAQRLGDKPVRLLKMDCEGVETKVLAGMTATLERWSPDIVLEILPRYPTMVAELAALPFFARYRKFLITDIGLIERETIEPTYEDRDWLFSIDPPARLIRHAGA